MRTQISLLIVVLLLLPTLAGETPKVTKLLIKFTASDLPSSAPAAKPKTMYLAGDRYARIEQEADSDSRAANLIIVSEPDIWLIDSVNKTGDHSKNPGPDFTVHNPILGPDGPEELFYFEFGHELEFLERAGAKSVETKQIRRRECEIRQLEVNSYRILLCLDQAKRCPVEVQVLKDGEIKFSVEYLAYEKGLPFDGALFEPPKNIVFSEAGQ